MEDLIKELESNDDRFSGLKTVLSCEELVNFIKEQHG